VGIDAIKIMLAALIAAGIAPGLRKLLVTP